jgi:signal peptidase I
VEALKRIVFLLALGVVGALIVRHFLFETIYIASPSMEPTLPVGTRLVENKLAYLNAMPQRGDIVVFNRPSHPEKGLVKRVIGVPGDSLEIKEKMVYVNGAALNEPYVQHTSPNTMFEGDNIAATTVPAGCVFVMGDNRDVSGDSRDWRKKDGTWDPFLPIKAISGRLPPAP